MNIRYAARARNDIDSILSYIASDNPRAAEDVRRAIIAAVKMIASRPYMGIRNARNPRLRSRSLSRYPYRIHYAVQEQEIVVLHVRHGARQPWAGDK